MMLAMSNVSSFRTTGVLPIPAGHTIEATFYKRPDDKDEAVVVVDLDTGITYGQHWHFTETRGFTVGEPVPLPNEVRRDLQLLKTVRGRVTDTQIAWIVINHPWPQTTIYFEAFPA